MRLMGNDAQAVCAPDHAPAGSTTVLLPRLWLRLVLPSIRSKPMRLIGIDPGLSGAFAFVSESDIHIHDMPLDDKREVIGAAITEMLEAYVPHIIVLENVHGPNNFKFGKAFGALLVTLKSSRFRLERVSPRTWQTAMLGHVTNDKSESIALALTNHPDAPLVRPGHRKPDHNRADALNIADYGRITYAPA